MTKILNKNNIDIILYHGECYDGFGCVVITKYFYEQNFGIERANSIQSIPCYRNKLLDVQFFETIENKNILMCDFSYKYDILTRIIDKSNSFLILDHHVTAETDLKKIDKSLKVFDMKLSGVGITWDYFFPNEEMPRLFKYIQDRDLWKLIYPETEAFVCSFYTKGFDYDRWKEYLNEDVLDKCLEEGSSWLTYKTMLVDRTVSKMCFIIQEINFKYVIVLYCNSSNLITDVGHEMLRQDPLGDFACIWNYNLYRNKTQYSFRSMDDRENVAIIAKKLGGGGHRNASSVSLEGCVGHLPYPIIFDDGIITLLKSVRKGNFNFGEEDFTYSLFEVSEIRESWLKSEYLDLIKRKSLNSLFIVFQTPSDSVVYRNNDIIHEKTYTIIFNEKAIKKPEKQLQFLAYASENVLTFTSDKEFDDMFNQHIDLIGVDSDGSLEEDQELHEADFDDNQNN